MARRKTKNTTGITRLDEIPYHDAWVAYICINCKKLNTIKIGQELLKPIDAFKSQNWKCSNCGYEHSKDSDLPFKNWPSEFTISKSVQAERFWTAFFRVATEHPESYWKQCNSCGRILPFSAFSKHGPVKGKPWGPLQRQMECRGCKGAINAELNPKRTKQQLFEGSINRRIADILLEGENEPIDIDELFMRFDNKCFKTKITLKIEDRKSWEIDHILPSKYLYPLKIENAALLSKEANSNKSDKWPSEFYTNSELIELAKITGADLSLLASMTPIINSNIDVNECVTRSLKVRENSNLLKRIDYLKKMLISYNLASELSDENKKILGFEDES